MFLHTHTHTVDLMPMLRRELGNFFFQHEKRMLG